MTILYRGEVAIESLNGTKMGVIEEAALSHVFVVGAVDIDGIEDSPVSRMTLKFKSLGDRAAKILS